VIEARDPRFTELEARELREKRRPARNPDSRRLGMLRWLLPHFFSYRAGDRRHLRFSWTEEHGFADRGFPRHGPQPKVKAQAPLDFLRMAAAIESAGGWNGADGLRKPQTEHAAGGEETTGVLLIPDSALARGHRLL
jgi:hypothetical protein